MSFDLHTLLTELFPLCRSVTGNGVRETFRILSQHIPLEVTEVPSGEECFDWTVPPEWNIRSGWIKNSQGEIIVDFAENNLHVMGYSEPVKGEFSLAELKPHLYSRPDTPDAIPYLTSYYKRRWGFCLSHRQLESLPEDRYQVEIDSSIAPGGLTLAESYLPGETEEEILFSCYTCHPSMANDSISGVVVNAALRDWLGARGGNYYSYRFVFLPETIGAIAYLSRNRDRVLADTRSCFVLTCCGDPGAFTYKKTKQGDHPNDLIVENILKHSGAEYKLIDFFLPGSDERQYSSPGFNIPTSSLMRSMYGFREYHSSLDNLAFVTAEGLNGTFAMYQDVIKGIEGDFAYKNLKPFCEPFLSKYGLYQTIGGQRNLDAQIRNILNALNYSDGSMTLVEIARKTGLSLLELIETARILVDKGLLERV